MTHFSLATSRPKRDSDGTVIKDRDGDRVEDTESHRITCFNGVGKTFEKYVARGMKVMVRSRIHYTSWTDQQDVKRYGTEIIADEISFLTRARKASELSGNDTTKDDDIPF